MRQRSFLRFGVLLVLFSGCSTTDDDQDAQQPPSTSVESTLERDTGVAWSVVRDAHDRVILASPLSEPKPPQTQDPNAIALDFYRRYAALFGVHDSDEPFVVRVDTDASSGVRHVLLNQRAGNVDVWNAGASLHLHPNGAIAWAEPTFVSGTKNVPTSPTISKEGATARAKHGHPSSVADGAELGVLAEDDDEPLKLVWQVTLRENAHATNITIDATNGRTIRTQNALMRVDANAFTSRHYAPQPFTNDATAKINVESVPIERWSLEQVPTQAAGGIRIRSTIAIVGGIPISDSVFGDKDSETWDAPRTSGAGAAVDAYVNGTRAAAWFESTFQRFGYAGGGRITSMPITVHTPLNGGGGFDPTRGEILFDDFSHGTTRILPPPAALDIVAHEYTHAVLHGHVGSGRVQFDRRCEPMNEALADIFAAFVEQALEPGAGNLTFGEVLGATTRDHMNPSSNPGNNPQIDVYTPGIEASAIEPHSSAGIPTKAWSMMTIGGDFRGVRVSAPLGWEQSRDLWFRTLGSLTKNPLGWLMPAVAARQIEHARQELRWSPEQVEQVACAWLAVDVLDERFVTQRLGHAPTCIFDPSQRQGRRASSSCSGLPTGAIVCNSQVPFSAMVCENGRFHHTILCDSITQRCRHSERDFVGALDAQSRLICQ